MIGYCNTLQTPGIAPSSAAKSAAYREVQKDDKQAIHDGRHAPGGISTIAPPIEIFHPIFKDFIRFIDDPKVQPTPEDLDNVRTLMSLVSQIFLSEEYAKGINVQLRQVLSKILNGAVYQELNSDGTSADGVMTLTLGTAHIMTLVLEWKREIGEGGCDSSTQAGLSMKRIWLDPTVGYNCCIHIKFISDY